MLAVPPPLTIVVARYLLTALPAKRAHTAEFRRRDVHAAIFVIRVALLHGKSTALFR